MDADRKEYTFQQWYKPMYENNEEKIIYKMFDFDNIEHSKKGYYIKVREKVDTYAFGAKREKIQLFLEKNEELRIKEYLPFRLSGDADYQIYDEHKNKKQEMHRLPNFSLCPVTGALNNIKGIRSLQYFLKYELTKYYDSKEVNRPYRRMGRRFKDPIKNDEVIGLEKAVLNAFFDIFDSLDEYCREIYFLSELKIMSLSPEMYWNERMKKAIAVGSDKKILFYDISADAFI